MGSLSDDVYMKEPTRKEMKEYNYQKAFTAAKFKSKYGQEIDGGNFEVSEFNKDLSIILRKEHTKGADWQLVQLRRLSGAAILKLLKK